MPYRFDAELATLVEITPNAVLDDITASRARATELILAATREIDLTGVNIMDTSVPGPPDAPDVAVRIYTPLIGARPAPAVLHLRGGGFVAGALGTGHRANIELSRSLGAVVIAVDYRLAPENPYPAALEDGYAALLWMVGRADRLGVDPARIAVHGVHNGAGLAAALALLSRDRGGPALCCQCLDRPELDDRHAAGTRTPEPAHGARGGHRPDVAARWDAYLGAELAGTDEVPVYAAPGRATDLRGLPPAYVAVVENDRLRDQGVAYADALRAAGVPVQLGSQSGAMPGSAPGRCTSAPGGRRRHRPPVAAAGAAGVSRERDEKITFLRAALNIRY
ncbi:alpha/beta hydrolase [Parafrankia elaeagni]|uniref:alpha/beta hydrolase n=1 Tax=Parafrankia elaeagni TaxID=222534 RepID=UPI00036A07F4|nr:alpha/beta hydrolase [Parafrankia elaeagni]